MRVRLNTQRPNTDAPDVPGCGVCRAGACIITRKHTRGTECLCTVELHVPLDGPLSSVSLRHQCASCMNARFTEIEERRRRRQRSTLFAT